MSEKNIAALVSVAALAASVEVVSLAVLAGWTAYGAVKLLACAPMN